MRNNIALTFNVARSVETDGIDVIGGNGPPLAGRAMARVVETPCNRPLHRPAFCC
ncbi:MAG: hypothetical protein ABIF82_15015 [Planctomycetota bacterium]